MKSCTTITLAILLLAGCNAGPDKIDGSSLSNFHASMKSIARNLPADRQHEFFCALRIFVETNVSAPPIPDDHSPPSMKAYMDAFYTAMMVKLNGLSPGDVLARSSVIVADPATPTYLRDGSTCKDVTGLEKMWTKA